MWACTVLLRVHDLDVYHISRRGNKGWPGAGLRLANCKCKSAVNYVPQFQVDMKTSFSYPVQIWCSNILQFQLKLHNLEYDKI